MDRYRLDELHCPIQFDAAGRLEAILDPDETLGRNLLIELVRLANVGYEHEKLVEAYNRKVRLNTGVGLTEEDKRFLREGPMTVTKTYRTLEDLASPPEDREIPTYNPGKAVIHLAVPDESDDPRIINRALCKQVMSEEDVMTCLLNTQPERVTCLECMELIEKDGPVHFGAVELNAMRLCGLTYGLWSIRPESVTCEECKRILNTPVAINMDAKIDPNMPPMHVTKTYKPRTIHLLARAEDKNGGTRVAICGKSSHGTFKEYSIRERADGVNCPDCLKILYPENNSTLDSNDDLPMQSDAPTNPFYEED